jgi:hypothetical protein
MGRLSSSTVLGTKWTYVSGIRKSRSISLKSSWALLPTATPSPQALAEDPQNSQKCALSPSTCPRRTELLS